jgi:hypothetical protein
VLEQSRGVASAGDVYFDLSMVEGVDGVAHLTEDYFESALFKIQESGFTDADRHALLEENARRLLAMR